MRARARVRARRNEPDLNADCINFNTTQWQDYYVIQTNAIQAAYADSNADVAAALQPCPFTTTGLATCPQPPLILASAFAASGFSGAYTSATNSTGGAVPGAQYLGATTVNNWQTQFPGNTANASLANMNAYSFHSYGKLGYELYATAKTLKGNVSAVIPGTPVVITEHQSHTNGDWVSIPTTADNDFEAARLAAQLAATAIAGFETYAFKFSSLPMNPASLGVSKSGLHWGENFVYPYPVGDATLSAEALRLVASTLNGGKALETLTESNVGSGLPPGNSRPNCVTHGALHRRVLIVNDGNCVAPVWTGCTNASALSVNLNLTAWSLATGTQLPVTVVAANSFSEIPAMLTVPANGVVNFNMSAFSTAVVTGPAAGSQTVSTPATPLEDAQITAGTNINANYGTSVSPLSVGTSTTADHSTTSVALFKFAVPASATSNAVTSAVLALTLAAAPTATSTMTVLGLNCAPGAAALSWSEAQGTWTAASFVINSTVTLNGQINSVGSNFVLIGGASGNTVAGHVTGIAGVDMAGTVKRLDVADYVTSCAGTNATFAIVRKFRNGAVSSTTPAAVIAGDNLSGGAAVQFHSKESAAAANMPSYAAALTIFGTSMPAPASPPTE